jgi:hypothetical protein
MRKDAQFKRMTMYKDNLFMTEQKRRPAKRPAPRGLWVLVGLAVVFIALEVVL